MKFLATLVLAVALTAGHCVPVHKDMLSSIPTPDQIRELTDAAIIYQQSVLPKAGSMPLPNFENVWYSVPEINTEFLASGKNGMAYGVNKVIFDQYEFDSSKLSTKFRLTAPNVTEVYDSEIEGKIFGHKVSGKGTTKIETTGNGYVVSNLRFEEINNSLQIASLELSLVMDRQRVEFEGLTVETITVEQLEDSLESYLMAKFEESKEEQGKDPANRMKTHLNKAMSGLSTDEVIQWLKEHANGEVPTDFIQNFVTSFSMVQ